MVERITDPHRPVQLPHATYRIPDGQDVPGDEIPPRDYAIGWTCFAILMIALVIGIVAGLPQ